MCRLYIEGCVPELGRSGLSEAKRFKVELLFSDVVKKFDTGESYGSGAKDFHSEHGFRYGLDVAVVLLNEGVEIF